MMHALLIRDDESRIDGERSGQIESALALHGWTVVSERSDRAHRLLETTRFDAVISTCAKAHAAAARLRVKMPWIADVRGTSHGLFEGRLLRGASAFTASSAAIARDLRLRYPSVPVDAIPTAFDARAWESIPVVPTQKATLLCVSEIQSADELRPLFAAVSTLLRACLISPETFALDFIPQTHPDALGHAVRRAGIGSVVRLLPAGEDRELFSRARSAARIVAIDTLRGCDDDRILQILGARRRILVIGNEQPPAGRTLSDSSVSERASSEKAIRDCVLRAVREWENHDFSLVDERALTAYGFEHFASKFREVLERVREIGTSRPNPTRELRRNHIANM